MGRLSTHVLDNVLGRPASGVEIELFAIEGKTRRRVTTARTNADGRTDAPLLSGDTFHTGTYELVFHVGPYFRSTEAAAEPPSSISCRSGSRSPSPMGITMCRSS